jgi:GDP-L-fucose synthase
MSTCVFPDDVEYPLKPSVINDGPPHYSNFGYAYAKRMIGVQLQAYAQQYGREWFSIIPTNVYGPHDNFNLETSHVIPALIHKTYLAKRDNTDLWIWGTGVPEREFIYSDDLARITLWLLDNYRYNDPIIVSTSQQISIKRVVELIAEKMGFEGRIQYDTEKPDGQFRKPSDTTLLHDLLPDFEFTKLDVGIEHTVNWFMSNYNGYNIRK